MQQDNFKRFKIHKIIQMVISIIFFIVYFLLLYFSRSLRDNMYTNMHLLSLCALLWLFMIYSFLCLMFDFKKLQTSIAEQHSLSRKAYLDDLTGIPNRYSCDLIFDTYRDAKDISEIGCVLMCISNLEEINETQGHEAGDKALQDFSVLLEKVADCYGFVGRNGGNEFIAVLENCSEDYVNRFLGDVKKAIHECEMSISIDSVYVLNHNEKVSRFMDLITLVYAKLS